MRARSTSAGRVLVVEDDPVTRELYAHFLRMRGFEVTTAATGAIGLMILREEPDCAEWLVTKVDLPGDICGWLVAEEYRSLYPDRMVIFVSEKLATLARSSARSFFLRERRPREALIVLEVLTGIWAPSLSTDGQPASASHPTSDGLDLHCEPRGSFWGPNAALRDVA